MTSKFKIITSKNSENLHLKLTGEFDAASAWHLIDEIKKNVAEFKNIIIDTDFLNEVYPFGVHIFHRSLKDLKKYNFYIHITGKKADEISAEGKLLINCFRQPKKPEFLKQKGMI